MKQPTLSVSNLARGLALIALVLFLGLGLTACTETDQPEPPQDVPPPPPPPPPPPSPPAPDQCPPNCTLTVTLPADTSKAPTASLQTLRAQAGASVTIVLVDQSNRPAKAATVLKFPGETPFLNAGGQPMQVVNLNPGKRAITVRDYDDAVCREADGGCKYDVVNRGDGERPVLDPRVIIWQ